MKRRLLASAAWVALLNGVGCGGSADPKRPSGVVAEVSDQIATVVHVRWTTTVPTTGYVEYGTSAADLGARTPLEATATSAHAVSLLGLTADTVTFFRVVTAEGNAAGASSAVQSIRTGDLPVGLPALTQTGSGSLGVGFIVVPLLGTKRAVVILNGHGDIVWYHTDERELDSYRARLSVDGVSLVYNAAKISGEPSPDSALVRVALDGSQSTAIPIPLLAHDFVEHPDGTLGALAFEDRDLNGTRVRGNKIVEVAPGGAQSTVWTSWNCFDPTKDPGDDPQQGWTFANALDYDPAEQAYYVGLRNFSSIAKVDRATGSCKWVLGLYGATFTIASGSARFLHQHQFQVRGNRILIMDNDGGRGAIDQSRLLEYQLDYDTLQATQTWTYLSNPPVYTFVLGEPIRLDDGGVFVNWSTAGQMERLDATGAQIWKLNTGAGFAFGFQTLANSLYGGGQP